MNVYYDFQKKPTSLCFLPEPHAFDDWPQWSKDVVLEMAL